MSPTIPPAYLAADGDNKPQQWHSTGKPAVAVQHGRTVDLSSLGRLWLLGQTNQPSRTEGEASGYEL